MSTSSSVSNPSTDARSTSSSGNTSVDSVRYVPSERMAARYSFWRITNRPMPTRPDPAIAVGQQRVRLGGLVGDDEVRRVVHQRIDVLDRHERLEPDLFRLRRLQRREVVVGDQHVVLRSPCRTP